MPRVNLTKNYFNKLNRSRAPIYSLMLRNQIRPCRNRVFHQDSQGHIAECRKCLNFHILLNTITYMDWDRGLDEEIARTGTLPSDWFNWLSKAKQIELTEMAEGNNDRVIFDRLLLQKEKEITEDEPWCIAREETDVEY